LQPQSPLADLVQDALDRPNAWCAADAPDLGEEVAATQARPARGGLRLGAREQDRDGPGTRHLAAHRLHAPLDFSLLTSDEPQQIGFVFDKLRTQVGGHGVLGAEPEAVALDRDLDAAPRQFGE